MYGSTIEGEQKNERIQVRPHPAVIEASGWFRGNDSMDLLFFFFQAEDGIRDLTVTGVQTCALPIYQRALVLSQAEGHRLERHLGLAPDHHRACRHLGIAVLQRLHRRAIPALGEQVFGERFAVQPHLDLENLGAVCGRRAVARIAGGHRGAGERDRETGGRQLHPSPTARTPVKRCTPVASPAGPSSKLVRIESRGKLPSDCSIKRRSRPATPYKVLPRLAQSK